MTINIIQIWENIGESYLNSNFEYTEDPSQKLSLNEAIQKSIEFLPNEVDDLQSTLRAIYEIGSRMQCAPKKPVVVAYNKFKEEIVTRLLNKHSYNELRDSIEISQENIEKEIDCISSDDEWQSALTNGIDAHNRGLLNTIEQVVKESFHNIRGIIYEVTNEKRCSSYLIGTVHFEDTSKYLEETEIQKKIENSSEFISEMGDSSLALRACTTMDDRLMRLASNKGIPIYALETIEDRTEANLLSKQLTEKELEEKGLLKRFKAYQADPDLIEIDCINAWKQGSLEEIQNINALSSKTLSVIKRNQNWVTGKRIDLIGKLTNAKRSISIAVGASHLFGETGLLKTFENLGLKIQQV